MASTIRAEFAPAKVTPATFSAVSFYLFAGITPESMELFGNILSLAS